MPALGQRKEPEIPVEKIKQLASIGCTDEEISLIAGISEATLQTRYQALLKEGRAAFNGLFTNRLLFLGASAGAFPPTGLRLPQPRPAGRL